MRKISRPLSVGVLVLAGLVGAACERAPEHRDVLLVTIDTLRPDHLGLYGYERPTSPEIKSWFGDAAVFERAYSTEASTSPSIVSILSGLLPHEHGVRHFYQEIPDDVRMLPGLLPDRYVSAGFVANVVLSDDAMAIASRFDHYDDTVDEIARRGLDGGPIWERRGSRTTDAALRWLADEADPERPLFLWVHYIDPHAPYVAPNGAPQRFSHDEPRLAPRSRVGGKGRPDQLVDAMDRVDDYDEEIAYVDAEVGRLLEGFAAIREIDSTLVILTADHGESMTEHEIWFSHGYHVYEEIIRVPLGMRGPGVPVGRFRSPVSGIDVAPTILAFAGADVPPSWEGFDLRRPTEIPAVRTIVAEAASMAKMFGHWRALIRGGSKWITGTAPGERPIAKRLHFELGADPDELESKPWSGTSVAEQTLIELAEAAPARRSGMDDAVSDGSGGQVAPGATPEQIRRLRALGYVDADEAE